MRRLVTLAACFVCGCCGAVQTGEGGSTPTADEPPGQEAAVAEVTALLEAHCETGIQNSAEHLPPDGNILIVGTAGEIMEGRATLEQSQESYGSRGIEVRYDCSEVQRWVTASADATVVWSQESIRTNARFPGIDVSFPSQRTLIFQRGAEGWHLSYYSLSVSLPDENLDSTFGVGHQPAPESVEAAAAPTPSGDAPAE